MDDRLPYQIANNIFKQGTECDNATWAIRRSLPEYLRGIRELVKVNMGKEYKPEWEIPIP